MAKEGSVHEQVSQEQKKASPDVIGLDEVDSFEDVRYTVLEDVDPGGFIIQGIEQMFPGQLEPLLLVLVRNQPLRLLYYVHLHVHPLIAVGFGNSFWRLHPSSIIFR